MTCKHGSTSEVCPYCDMETIEANQANSVVNSKIDSGASAEHIAVDQPKPVFSLNDLAEKLQSIYNWNVQALKDSLVDHNLQVGDIQTMLKASNSMLQELVAVVDKHKRDLQAIDVFMPNAPQVIEEFRQEKPDHYVCGVQLIENGQLVGTSLYTTIVKARIIRDTLNKKFAELKVNHEAKIINYPVF